MLKICLILSLLALSSCAVIQPMANNNHAIPEPNPVFLQAPLPNITPLQPLSISPSKKPRKK